jgi:hypothetical protein
MPTIRSLDETADVAITTAASTVTVVAATHAWLAGGLFGLLFVLRFALQPPDGNRLTPARRAVLALVGCSALGCLIWAFGVRFAHWPG